MAELRLPSSASRGHQALRVLVVRREVSANISVHPAMQRIHRAKRKSRNRNEKRVEEVNSH